MHSLRSIALSSARSPLFLDKTAAPLAFHSVLLSRKFSSPPSSPSNPLEALIREKISNVIPKPPIPPAPPSPSSIFTKFSSLASKSDNKSPEETKPREEVNLDTLKRFFTSPEMPKEGIVSSKLQDLKSAALDFVDMAEKNSKHHINTAKEASMDMVEGLKSQARSTANKVTQPIQDSVDAARDTIERGKDAARGTIERGKDAMEQQTEGVKEEVKRRMEAMEQQKEEVKRRIDESVESVTKPIQASYDNVVHVVSAPLRFWRRFRLWIGLTLLSSVPIALFLSFYGPIQLAFPAEFRNLTIGVLGWTVVAIAGAIKFFPK